jgi:hypothetical protein
LKRDAHYYYDMGKVGPAISFMLKHVGGPERPLATRTRIGAAFMGDGLRAMRALAENHYRATDELVERLDLGEEVRASLRQTLSERRGSVPLVGGALGVVSGCGSVASWSLRERPALSGCSAPGRGSAT